MNRNDKKRKLEGTYKTYRLPSLFALVVVLILGIQDHSHHPPQITENASFFETLTGIPQKILSNAWDNGGFRLFLFGTSEEKHTFAKGYPTRFGQMSFDSDDYLKYNQGWSEQRIHTVGYRFGFSQKPGDKKRP